MDLIRIYRVSLVEVLNNIGLIYCCIRIHLVFFNLVVVESQLRVSVIITDCLFMTNEIIE